MSGRTSRMATAEPRWLRYALTALGLGFLFFFLALPLVAVFVEAFSGGFSAYTAALADGEIRSTTGKVAVRGTCRGQGVHSNV